MSEICLEQQLAALNFALAGKIIGGPNGKISFDLIDEARYGTCVYMWIKQDRHGVLVGPPCYIGIAGDTLRKRCDQHDRIGFNGRTRQKGWEHAREIRQLQSAGYEIAVWAKECDVVGLLGEEVSLALLEEMALIWKFQPPWNKPADRKRKTYSSSVRRWELKQNE
ncbi:hypothetical protein JYK14_24895 [Siccirubricoccus sp. KC 17139]|uniref:GIY-YIG domain-containing protein n=1 Tax=Siccirubricoccus soli TaxID=2899147 RepID=A0ABT1DBU9_9PROT|nr:hypothetical protein [Siccirubricoccus soli]MCO6419374.1 hypothetical protein [Siccirubricoccus soli]MCP2685509.1 hypothetical protein [Siccirubricoccus soli]